MLSDTVPVIFFNPQDQLWFTMGMRFKESHNYAVSGKTSEMTIEVKNIGLTSANQCIAVVSAITNGLQVEAKS